jgi:UPF0716 family protein affecting phage T7 exclusion
VLGLIIFALMIGVIWLEITVFGIIGDEIGVLLTIIGVFVTAALGLRLLRSSGRATMQRMAQSVQAGRPPILDVADGVAILAGAGLLLIPGYATDAMGLILFIPGLRTILVVALYGLLRPFASRFSSRSSFQFYQSRFTDGFTQGQSQDNPFGDQPKTRRQNPNTHSIGDDAANTIIEGDYKRQDKSDRNDT